MTASKTIPSGPAERHEPPSRAAPLACAATWCTLAASVLIVACGAGDVPRDAAACTDYYDAVNAPWIATTPLPASEEESAGYDSNAAAESQVALLAALASDSASTRNSSDAALAPHRPLLTLYRQIADREGIESAGTEPLAAALAEIATLRSPSQLPQFVAHLIRRGVRLPLDVGIRAFDDDESDAPAADTLRVELEAVSPAGRQPGASDDTGFREYVGRVLALAGDSDPRHAEAVTAIEHLASQRSSSLQTATPGLPPFDQNAFLDGLGVSGTMPVVFDPAALDAMALLQSRFDIEAWRAFLSFRLIVSSLDLLPARFVAEYERWNLIKPPPRIVADKLRVDPTLASLVTRLPHEVDEYFVRRVLPPGTGATVRDMADRIRAAVHRRIDQLPWASAATRVRMHTALDDTPVVLLGFEPPTASAAPAMDAASLLANARRAAACDFDRRLALATSSLTGRTAAGDSWWKMEASFNIVNRSVVLGALQVSVPVKASTSRAQLYGSLGSMIAHELFHRFAIPSDIGFNKQAPFDWFDPVDRPFIDAEAVRANALYTSYAQKVFEVTPPSPRYIGEDMADLGSVQAALLAFESEFPGSPSNELYAGFAMSGRRRSTALADQSYVRDTPAHAIHFYRVNAPLSNMPSFARTFGCSATDPMVRSSDQRLELW